MSIIRSVAPSRRSLAAALLLYLALSANGQVPLAAPEERPIRIGLMNSMFKNQHETDVTAALKVWIMTITEQRNLRWDLEPRVYSSHPDALQALRSGDIDGLTMLLDEYSRTPADLISGPFVRDETNGNTHEEFVVITRKDRNLTSWRDLEGAKLGIHDDEHVGLASAWMDAGLATAGLAAVTELSASVEYSSKFSAIVLGVFFDKYDAALVSHNGLVSMAELNPQVGQQLHIMKTSPAVIPALFCFRAGLPNVRKREVATEILRMHESVTGEQVLNVFKADRMVELTSEQIERSLALLDKWQQASAKRQRPSLQARGSTH